MTKELSIFNLIIMLSLFIILILINMNLTPILIMINLTIFSLLIFVKISLWKSNFLYSIILFLIMISGLLIIFLYFSSLISSERTNFKFNKLLLINFMLNYLIFFFIYNKLCFLNFELKKFFFLEIFSIMKFNEMNYQNILNFYTYPFNNFTIISLMYLLISLFTIIKICSTKSKTLRKIS
uniref:NADH dehydrogenase subunit 6 n=1 Tax=Acropyga smithii TaxID=602228 RepID=A0A6G5NJ66_9HYME|nr:NADH dehydrogenase subunit 6 [Acropyga smithii]QBG38708.1 NADH dehydrogenase subunit 6 [Acropyga smithii]